MLNLFADSILRFKQTAAKPPSKTHPEKKEQFEHLVGFVFSYVKFTETKDLEEKKDLANKGQYHLYKLWEHLFNQSRNLAWYCNNNGFDQELHKKYTSGRMNIYDFKDRIKQAYLEQELQHFFIAFPYLQDLIEIDVCLTSNNYSSELDQTFNDIISSYHEALDQYNTLYPLLGVREYLYHITNDSNLDQGFCNKHRIELLNNNENGFEQLSFSFLANFINSNIPYPLRKAPGFRQIDWDNLTISNKSLKNIEPELLVQAATNLKIFIDELLIFQFKQKHLLAHKGKDNDAEIKENLIKLEQEINVIDLSEFAHIRYEANIEPMLEIGGYYLNKLNNIQDDSNISRLAVLRISSAFGEAIKQIAPILSSTVQDIKVFTSLRDHLAHSTTYKSLNYLKDIIYNPENKLISEVIVELKDFIGWLPKFTQALRVKQFDTLIVPCITKLTNFNQMFEKNRKQDDRDVKLTSAEFDKLEKSLPTDDKIENPHFTLIRELFNNINNGVHVNLRKEQVFDALSSHLSKTELNKLYDNLNELNKINNIKTNIHSGEFNFNSIKLNLKSEYKQELEIIKQKQDKQQLLEFLNKHSERNNIDFDKILSDNKFIDLTSHKELLTKLISKSVLDFAKIKFDKAVDIMFHHNQELKTFWQICYAKLQVSSEKLQQLKMQQLKLDQIVHLEYSIDSILRLKELSSSIFDGKYINIDTNSSAALACEMLFGFCTNGFKPIVKNISKLTNYNDETLYWPFTQHPIVKTKQLLEDLIIVRNHIFHFEGVFNGNFSIKFCQESWFNALQNLGHGLHFPNAICFTSTEVKEQPHQTEALVVKLESFLQNLKSTLGDDTQRFNWYELLKEPDLFNDLNDEESLTSTSFETINQNIENNQFTENILLGDSLPDLG